MAVSYRHTDTLAGDHRLLAFNDTSIRHFAPDPQRFLLTLLFFAANVRNDVVKHLRPIAKGFTGPGNRLVSRHYDLRRFEFIQCMQCRHIALNRAVRLHGDKPCFGTQTFALLGNYLEMLRIDLRNDHWNIWSPAVC
ncbi:hypothetical protein D3C75_928980 [compost metagenome]